VSSGFRNEILKKYGDSEFPATLIVDSNQRPHNIIRNLTGYHFRTTCMLTLFSQVLTNVEVPTVTYRKGVGLQVTWFALFKLFPVMLPQILQNIFI
jgi:hypothetical protein